MSAHDDVFFRLKSRRLERLCDWAIREPNRLVRTHLLADRVVECSDVDDRRAEHFRRLRRSGGLRR